MNLTYNQVYYEYSKWDVLQADAMLGLSEPDDDHNPCSPRCLVNYANNCANPINFFKKRRATLASQQQPNHWAFTNKPLFIFRNGWERKTPWN
jgi:hypothetical protein